MARFRSRAALGLAGEQTDAAITRTILAIAKSLELRVIAKGVETEEQFAFLKSEGCEEAQGYLFSKPLPAQELERLLRVGLDGGREPHRRAA